MPAEITVKLLKDHGHKAILLSLARVLKIPMHGPCTHCPVPPAMVLPPRRLPPTLETRAAAP